MAPGMEMGARRIVGKTDGYSDMVIVNGPVRVEANCDSRWRLLKAALCESSGIVSPAQRRGCDGDLMAGQPYPM